ncbi:hypothetical protein AK812_SmicGene23411 [Symbiodinium microadriaticum]|uniref:PARP-type domain-containing protein n=1 Tax=Symbiodinium microadriaticum TaxID=2951 RepID=A0A1Q9DH99_SYMMI|nr:hypothetical protein AK812_SmicGene23411 [Symbiodinium microadriaticum]
MEISIENGWERGDLERAWHEHWTPLGMQQGPLYGYGVYCADAELKFRESSTKADEYAEDTNEFDPDDLPMPQLHSCECLGERRQDVLDGPYHSVLGDRVVKLKMPVCKMDPADLAGRAVTSMRKEAALQVHDNNQIFPEFILYYKRLTRMVIRMLLCVDSLGHAFMQQMMMGGMMPGLMPGMPGLPGMPAISEQQTTPAAEKLRASQPAVAQAAEPEALPSAPEAAPVAKAKEPPPSLSQPKKEVLEWPAWLRFGAPCSVCGDASTADAQPHGVICRRRRKNTVGGCGKGVCWVCMEREPRSKFGMVRTTREEFESLEESAWWMHEACMEPSDLRAYFGGEKELAEARAAADASDTVVPDKVKTKEPDVDPLEAEQERIKKMPVKELKAYLDRHNTSHADLFEKPDLLARALEVALKSGPEPPPGPAWMKSGDICRLCGKPQMQDEGGVFCRRRRQDGRIAGCGEAICWRCMKRAPKDAFGKVRCTKEEFAGLGQDAWWMHQHCFEDGDWQDYFGEPEPEEERWRRTGESNWQLGERV